MFCYAALSLLLSSLSSSSLLLLSSRFIYWCDSRLSAVTIVQLVESRRQHCRISIVQPLFHCPCRCQSVLMWKLLLPEFQKLCSTAVLCSVVMLLIVIIIIVLSHLIVSMVMVYQLCQFGESQKLRLVRILRSTVMVRVGGGWVALDEFLVKNDPCRGTPSTLPLVRLS